MNEQTQKTPTPEDIHAAAQAIGRLGGLKGKGKPKHVPKAVAHARAKKAGQANKDRWAKIMADRRAMQQVQAKEGALPNE